MILGSEQASLNVIIEPRVLYWDGSYAQHTQSFVWYVMPIYQCISCVRSTQFHEAVTKFLQLSCALVLLSSFNSKFLSKLTPPVFLFLMSYSHPLFSISHFLPELRKDALLCSEWTPKPMICGKEQRTHLENKCTPLEYKFNTPLKNLTAGRTDIQSTLYIQCNGRKRQSSERRRVSIIHRCFPPS